MFLHVLFNLDFLYPFLVVFLQKLQAQIIPAYRTVFELFKPRLQTCKMKNMQTRSVTAFFFCLELHQANCTIFLTDFLFFAEL